MTRHHFMNGRVILDGMPRYSIDAVLGEYVRIIDGLTAQFGAEGSTFTTDHPGFKREKDWKADGKEEACRVWRSINELYDVVAEALVHRIGPFTVRAYLLGRAWCRYRPEDDTLLTPEGKPVQELDTAPVIGIFGEPKDEGYRLLSQGELIGALDAVSSAAEHPLNYLVTNHRDEAGIERGFTVFASMSHEHVGDGIGLVLVRCLPDGRGALPVVRFSP